MRIPREILSNDKPHNRATATLSQSEPTDNFNLSIISAEIGDRNLMSVRNRELSQPLRPFYHHDGVLLIQHLIQAERKNLARAAFNAIEIEMIHAHPPVELIHDRECRAVDFGGINIQARAQAFGEDRFA